MKLCSSDPRIIHCKSHGTASGISFKQTFVGCFGDQVYQPADEWAYLVDRLVQGEGYKTWPDSLTRWLTGSTKNFYLEPIDESQMWTTNNCEFLLLVFGSEYKRSSKNVCVIKCVYRASYNWAISDNIKLFRPQA